MKPWKIWLIVAAAVVILILAVKKVSIASTKISLEFSDYANAAAQSYSVPVTRVKAMIYQESNGDTTAVGAAGERGLMQIEPGALADFNRVYNKSYTFDQLFEPDINIEVGTGYLAFLASMTGGDIDLATQAYNAGIGNVKADPTRGIGYLNSVKTKEEFFM